MTEAEAKTKWYPFVRAVTVPHYNGQPTYNRMVDGASWVVPQGAMCVGAKCMAWRDLTVTATYTHDGQLVGPGQVVLRGTTTERREVVGGFCGLAGKP